MADFRTIEIDFDVHKKIELERKNFAETPNAVLRRLLNIESSLAPMPLPLQELAGGRPWSRKGVTLPHGTELRMEYNGRVYMGTIHDGVWVVEGKQFNSPSAAAGGVAVTKDGSQTNLDGWIYWYVRLPGASGWVRLSSLRPEHNQPPSSQLPPAQESAVHVTPRLVGDDLPTENQVIAELENFLRKQLKPIAPPDAYRALADIFGLSKEQRQRLMPNSNEVHWENRVRQARRKLVNSGKIDRTVGHGLWALKKNARSGA